MKYNRIQCLRRTGTLLLAALFSMHFLGVTASGDVSGRRGQSLIIEDDEGGPEEVWLEYDLGIPDHAFRRRMSREGGRASPSSLEEYGATPSSLPGLRATESGLSLRFRSLAASPSELGISRLLAGLLPASPSRLLKTAGAKKLNVHVTKSWSDGAAAHTGDAVTVRLLANGADTGETAVLSSENHWEAVFPGLPLTDGEGVIDYRVSEEVPSGYVPFYTYSGGADGLDYWVPAMSLEEGETYVLAAEGMAPTAEGGEGPIIMRMLDRQTRARRIEGVLCHDYITDPGADAQWIFSEGERGYEMMNAETGEMLSFDRVDGSYVYTMRENPASTRRAFFPADAEADETGIEAEIGAKIARSQALGRNGETMLKGAGALFRVYRRSSGNWELEASIDNRRAEHPDPKVVIPHRKTIDAFRDGAENPDTDLDNGAADLTDLYRLYLDAGTVNETLPLNVVLVLDYSGSMNPRDDDPRRDSYYMDGQTRYEVLRDTVCPAEQDGIIDLILSDPDNRMSLVTFSWMYQENTAIACDWTDSADDIREVILNGHPAEGTNYDMALRMTSELLHRIPADRKDYPTYVLFMSDGVPTEYVTENGLPGGYVMNGVSEVSGPSGNYGSVGVETVQNLRLVIPKTLEAVERFQAEWPKVNVSTVAFSNQDMSAVICVPEFLGGQETADSVEMEEGYTYDMVLREMIRNRGAFYTAATGEELKESFEDMILASRVSHAVISDELSPYVDVYEEQPDFLVTMKKEGEEAIVLWENGALTGAGEGKLRRVVYDGQKTVRAEFEPDYVLEEDYVYTLSFNVKTTKTAYEEYAAETASGGDGYSGVTGDSSERFPRETDYGENATSTGLPGFHSDASAVFTYSVRGRLYEDPYLHPVIQVSDLTLEILKVDSTDETKVLPGAGFDLYLRLEAGDGPEGVTLPGAEASERFRKVNAELLVTGEDGTVRAEHLIPGVYRLWEKRAPGGYQLPEKTWEVVLGNVPGEETPPDPMVTVLGTEGGVTAVSVRNTMQVVLPAAGGGGSSLILLAGIALAAAGVLLRKYPA